MKEGFDFAEIAETAPDLKPDFLIGSSKGYSLARRLKVPLDRFPKIVAVEAACLKLPAFDKARPEKQPDAE